MTLGYPEPLVYFPKYFINPLNAMLNPICHLLALLGAHPILYISRIRVNIIPKSQGIRICDNNTRVISEQNRIRYV
jgi:hypothetical protein